MDVTLEAFRIAPQRTFRRTFAYAALLFLTMIWPTAAERVLIVTPSSEKGHGWMFGSNGAEKGECWIATARHIIENPYTKKLSTFAYTDQRQVSGESGQPIAVKDLTDGLALAGLEDLAFAKVNFGREKGKCLSRLGLNTLAYGTALRSSPELTIYNLLPTSFGTFTARVSGGGMGEADGLLRLRPTSDLDARMFLKRGLSGAIAEAMIGGVVEPFAMVQKVEPDQSTFLALRFDRIRTAFEMVQSTLGGSETAPRANAAYMLIALEGDSIESSPTDLRAGDPSSCWRFASTAWTPGVRLTIGIPATADAVESIRIGQTKTCNTDGAPVLVEARVDNLSDWSRMPDCKPDASGESYECRLGLRGPRQLRLSFLTRQAAGLSSFSLR